MHPQPHVKCRRHGKLKTVLQLPKFQGDVVEGSIPSQGLKKKKDTHTTLKMFSLKNIPQKREKTHDKKQNIKLYGKYDAKGRNEDKLNY